MKRFYKIFFIPLILSALLLSSAYTPNAEEKKPFGAFVGLNSENMDKLLSYKEVIIDAAYYSKEDINKLHQNDVKVYSYLNIGSLEDFRTYYDRFKDITLGAYENWPNERWIDVSKKKWQDFIVDEAAKALFDKGVDGFFIDNMDMYYVYKKSIYFDGILNILKGLKQKYDKNIIINSGYSFINKAIYRKIDLKNLIYGAARESVVTRINFANNTFYERPKTDTASAMLQLKQINLHIPNIYVIEYSKDKKLDEKIKQKFSNTKFKVYISKSIELN